MSDHNYTLNENVLTHDKYHVSRAVDWIFLCHMERTNILLNLNQKNKFQVKIPAADNSFSSMKLQNIKFFWKMPMIRDEMGNRY